MADPRTARWTAAALPSVLVLERPPTDVADPRFRLGRNVLAGLIVDQAGDVVIARAGAVIRLHVNTPSADTPGVLLPLDRLFEVRVQAALRLWRVVMGKRPGPDPAILSRARTDRLILALRALDGRAEGASYRDLACILPGGVDLADRSWISHDARDRIKRLVQLGQGMVRGGYRRLLLHPYRGRV
jgi:Uncharacterized conserved protein (DUF2285)